jgi:hypothetical protein
MARRLGGQLVRLSSSDFDLLKSDVAWEDAPYTHEDLAVHWSKKIIAYSGEVPWASLVHEMAHVFASGWPPPRWPKEWRFFGWAVAVAKIYGLETWIRGNKDYNVTDDGETMMELRRPKRMALLEERLAFAKSIGLVSSRGRPLSIR